MVSMKPCNSRLRDSRALHANLTLPCRSHPHPENCCAQHLYAMSNSKQQCWSRCKRIITATFSPQSVKISHNQRNDHIYYTRNRFQDLESYSGLGQHHLMGWAACTGWSTAHAQRNENARVLLPCYSRRRNFVMHTITSVQFRLGPLKLLIVKGAQALCH